jgi:hypothetical protein
MIDISEDELKSMLMEAWVAGWYDKDRTTDEEKIPYSENVISNIKYKIKDLSSLEKRFLEQLNQITTKDYAVPERYGEMCESVRIHYSEMMKDIFDLMNKRIKELEKQVEEARDLL